MDDDPSIVLPKEAALAWAQAHGYQGAELPKGIRGNENRCPLALATGYKITSFARAADGRQETLPLSVLRFVGEFDFGWYPELEAGIWARIRCYLRNW